jgi:KamA family protein
VSRIDPNDPNDPIRRQIIPTAGEVDEFTGMMEDSLAEDRHSPVPGLVHRYPDRVLMLVTTQCASYCRYCTRARIVGDPTQTFSKVDFEAQLDYIRRTPQVRDVLLSGGDPLTLAPKVLDDLLAQLRAIPHVEIIRIGSRVPVFMPMRVTEELTETLQKYHPLWFNIHVNHPNEISQELADAADRLSRAGVPLGNQSVLLAGVNDCVHIQRDLVQKLIRIRVRPYYLYQCDLVEGAGHFRTPVAKGIEIIEGLRGHTSGFAVPTFVVDAPGGGGKIPVMPNYHISSSDHKFVLRNYEGFITPTKNRRITRRTTPRPASTAATSVWNQASPACTGCCRAKPCPSSRKTSTPCTTAAANSTASVLTATSGDRWGLGPENLVMSNEATSNEACYHKIICVEGKKGWQRLKIEDSKPWLFGKRPLNLPHFSAKLTLLNFLMRKNLP